MNRTLVYTSQFKRDYKKRSREKGIDALLTGVVDGLMAGQSLPVKFRAYPDNPRGPRDECHLPEPEEERPRISGRDK